MFQRSSEESEEPFEWLRKLLARYFHRVEDHIGAQIARRQEPRTVYRPLGCGAFGCVFALSDGRVLKITSDENEGPLTERIHRLQRRSALSGRWPIMASTARVDTVFRFPQRVRCDPDEDPQWIYGIVRERVDEAADDIPEDLASAMDLYTYGWETYCMDDEPGGRLIGSMIARAAIPKVYRSGGVYGKRIAALLRSLWNEGGPLMDVHRYNLARRLESGVGGARIGDVVIFDFGSDPSYPMGQYFDCTVETARSIDVKRLFDYDTIAREIPIL